MYKNSSDLALAKKKNKINISYVNSVGDVLRARTNKAQSFLGACIKIRASIFRVTCQRPGIFAS